ncbi:MAG: NPCBM/NEW2 domain-containing protein [Phycisphaerae bacterium]|nr:NPCBM/NEW2 domain-containing protein [Phycisphaerae bacterium]
MTRASFKVRPQSKRAVHCDGSSGRMGAPVPLWAVVLLAIMGAVRARADGPTGATPGVQPEVVRRQLRIHRVDGDQMLLTLSRISNSVIAGEADGREVSIPLADVMRIAPESGETRGTVPLSDATRFEFHSGSGGFFRGTPAHEPPNSLNCVRVDLGLERPVDVAFAALSGIVFDSNAAVEMREDFAARLRSRQAGRDTLVLIQGGKPVAVQGSLEKLTAAGWEFSFSGKLRSGDFGQAYGVVFGAPASSPAPSPVALITSDGGRFSGRIVSADAEAMAFDCTVFGTALFPWRVIRSVDLQSDRVKFLSDLTPSRFEQQSMPGADWKPRMNATVTGKPIRLGGKVYGKGIGVHAKNRMMFELDGQFERFSAVVGIDDSTGDAGSVVFRVFADDKLLFESSVQRGGAAPALISVDVSDAKTLILLCEEADNLDLADHAVWANAMLVRPSRASKQ